MRRRRRIQTNLMMNSCLFLGEIIAPSLLYLTTDYIIVYLQYFLWNNRFFSLFFEIRERDVICYVLCALFGLQHRLPVCSNEEEGGSLVALANVGMVG